MDQWFVMVGRTVAARCLDLVIDLNGPPVAWPSSKLNGGPCEAQRTQYSEGDDHRGEEGSDDDACTYRHWRVGRHFFHHQRSRRRVEIGKRSIGLRSDQSLGRNSRDRLIACLSRLLALPPIRRSSVDVNSNDVSHRSTATSIAGNDET